MRGFCHEDGTTWVASDGTTRRVAPRVPITPYSDAFRSMGLGVRGMAFREVAVTEIREALRASHPRSLLAPAYRQPLRPMAEADPAGAVRGAGARTSVALLTPSRSAMCSPTRMALAIAVSAGLTAPMLGKKLVSAT